MSNNIKIKDINFNEIVGKRYKNWKQFCEENNINYNSHGVYTRTQKQELERYCKIKWIDKREFIIKEIYDKPKANKKTQGRLGEFASPIEILLRYLPQDEYMSMSKIMLELGLITQDYVDYKFNQRKCVKEIMYELDKPHFGIKDYDDYALGKIVHNFYMQSNFISETIKGKLNTLAKNNIIELKIKTKIKKNDKYRYATSSEEELIKQAEKEALELMNRENKKEVLFANEFEEFYSKVVSLLSSDGIKLDMYYPAYKFKFIDGKKGRKLSEDKINKLKQELHISYANKVLENLDMNNNHKSIEFIQNVSHKSLEVDKIETYLKTLCDILICGKAYVKYTPPFKKKTTLDEDKENGIPF